MILCHCNQMVMKGGYKMNKGKIRPLRILIYEKFDSESQMAENMGWSKQKLNRITNGIKEPTIQELSCMCKCLDKSISELALIFLEAELSNGDNDKEVS